MASVTTIPSRTIILLATLAAVAMATFAVIAVSAQGTPGAITGISVDTATPGQAAITWNEVSIARDYRVMWAPIDQDYKTYTDPSGNLYPTGNSQTLTGLAENAQYKFRIRAPVLRTPGRQERRPVVQRVDVHRTGHAASSDPGAHSGAHA